MRKNLLVLLVMMLAGAMMMSAKNNEDAGLNYELEGAGTGSYGTYLVKVMVLTKNKNVSDEEIARCAVHGVLFRGFNSKELRQSQRPLAGSAMAEAQHADFFKEFFKKGGIAKNYVSSVSGSRQVTKAGKQYKISSVVTVNKALLQKDLEKAGIIKGLNAGF